MIISLLFKLELEGMETSWEIIIKPQQELIEFHPSTET